MATTRLLGGIVGAGLVAAAGGTIISANIRSPHWKRVAADSNYAISIDTARLSAHYGAWPIVWYRTDHVLPRLYKGKEFDREIVQSVVRCDSLWFKVVSVDMSMGSRQPVARQLSENRDLSRQPWRNVERGTIEEVVARAACAMTGRR
jgi:hypothetical protein